MSVVVVTAPVPGISLALVKTHLRVDGDDDDDFIKALTNAVCAHIDGPDGSLGRSIWPQTLELRQDRFCSPIRLPYGPVTGITSIKYIDITGVEQALPDAGYALLSDGLVGLAYNASWPSHRGDAEGVRIRYQAGYVTLPPAILSAVLLMVGDLYRHRESAGSTAGQIQTSATVDDLLSPFKNWRV